MPKPCSRWRRRPIAVAMSTVAFGVPAYVRDGLGIVTAAASAEHGLPCYAITHLATGIGFGVYFDTLRAAKHAAEWIAEQMPDVVTWGTDRTGAWDFETRAEMRKFLHSLPKR
jgi:hypothetical protein